MNAAQQYIRQHGLDSLVNEHNISVVRHPTEPLVSLRYRPSTEKFDPIAMSCRGHVLEVGTWNMVCPFFNRFFRHYERASRAEDWTSFVAEEKLDGSLLGVYHYNSKWRFNTKGSFGNKKVDPHDITFEELALEAMRGRHLTLDPYYTYIFELTSPFNRIIRQYDKTDACLLTVFDPHLQQELSIERRNRIADASQFSFPRRFYCQSLSHAREQSATISSIDPTFEGFVLRSHNDQRIKVKAPRYDELHHLYSENPFDPRKIVPRLFNGKIFDDMKALPWLENSVKQISFVINRAVSVAGYVYLEHKDKDIKDFARAVKDEPLRNLLFLAKRNGAESPGELLVLAENNPKIILRCVFGVT